MRALLESALVVPAGTSYQTELAAREALAGRSRGWKAFLPFVGPAVIASVGYMDPGNFATNIQAGSSYGYQLLWVVALANLIAMLFQAMSAKLGIVTGRNLAQLCRDEFPKPLVIGMWIASELAAMATDLAEFLGGALGISLLFHFSLPASMGITALVTCALLSLDKRGFRPLELVIAALIGVIGISYVLQLVVMPPDWHSALYHTVAPQLPDHAALLLAVGIIGATIMPHTLYLHSGLTQQRTPPRDDGERRRLLRWSNREVVAALGVAGAINLAMLVMSADLFHGAVPPVTDLGTAYRAMLPVLGLGAAKLFLVALIASGISSSVVGTLAGQVVMQGFVGFRIPLWLRRAATMAPAFAAALWLDPMKALIESQAVLSFVLPLPLVALVVLSSRASVMGAFVARRGVQVLAAVATVLIVALNAVLVAGMF